MQEIQRNRINKSDNKEKIAEKINKCNENCINNLQKYNEVLEKILEYNDINEKILLIQNFIKQEDGINKILDIQEYYKELFEGKNNEEENIKNESIKNNIEKLSNEITQLYNDIFYNKEEEKTIQEKLLDIQNKYNTIISNEDSIVNNIETYNNKTLPVIKNNIKENSISIQNYKNELLGVNNNDENSIKFKIEDLYTKIKNYN